jgi:beta-mannosidase
VLTAPDGRQTVHESAGCELNIPVEQPALWQPNGWGGQPLYTLALQCLSEAGAVLDEAERRVGLRTITLSQEADEQRAASSASRVNGNRLFAMGADYIPEDNLLGRTSPERTRELLTACAEANFNVVARMGRRLLPGGLVFRPVRRAGADRVDGPDVRLQRVQADGRV